MRDLGVGLREQGVPVRYALSASALPLRLAAERAGFEVVPLGRRIGSDIWHLHLANTYDRQALRLLTRARAGSSRLLITEHLPRTDASDARLAERRPRRGAPTAKAA
jgi:hypothetical protein